MRTGIQSLIWMVMTRHCPRRAGFTLIEVMISVAIVAILASIAIPNFINYQLRVKTSEARTLVGNIVTTQNSFAAEFEGYANIELGNPSAVPGIGKRNWDRVACDTNCDRDNLAACGAFDCIGFEPPAPVYFQYYSPGTISQAGIASEFAVGAVGDLDGDSRQSSFCFQSSNSGSGFGSITVPQTACQAGVESTVLHNCNPANF